MTCLMERSHSLISLILQMWAGRRKREGDREGQSGRRRRRLLKIGSLEISPWLLHLLCAAGVAGVQLLLTSSSYAERGAAKQRGRWVA
jgi:truncated hemoglobin YjbI